MIKICAVATTSRDDKDTRLEISVDTNLDFAEDFFQSHCPLCPLEINLNRDQSKEDEYKAVLRELFARASRIVVHGVECGYNKMRGVEIWVKSLDDLPQSFEFNKHSHELEEIEVDGIPLDIGTLIDHVAQLSDLLADDRFPTIAEKLTEFTY